MKNYLAPRSHDEWREVEKLFRQVAQKWAALEARLHERIDPDWSARYTSLAEASSPEAFVRAWKRCIGALDAMFVSEELADASPRYSTYEALVRDALRWTEVELDLGADRGPFRDMNESREWEEEVMRGTPDDLPLVIDHACYALYVAWSPQSRIVIPDNRPRLLKAIADDPGIVSVVSPRAFEELVAFLYESFGCRAQLTQESRDFGADILVWHPAPLRQDMLIAIQVKRYTEGHTVGLKGVQELHGAVTHYHAHTGHLVTSSRFSGPAQRFADECKYGLVRIAEVVQEIDQLLRKAAAG